METKTFIRSRLAEGGIAVEDELLDRLVPVYRQWRRYVEEIRRIDVPREEEPAHGIPFRARTGADHVE